MSTTEPSTNYNFMKGRYFWFAVSFLLIVWGAFIWTSTGNNKYGIDFLGGTDLVVKFNEQIAPVEIRKILDNAGISGAIVQAFEEDTNEFSIRFKGTDNGNVTKDIQKAFEGVGGGFTVLKNDFVGPVIGEKIKVDGFKAVAISIIGLLIYIAWRFEWTYGMGAIIAVFHDVFISASIFIYTGGEIGAGALAALLTILGYSVNDTIVTFDRIRENLTLKDQSKSAKVGSLSLKDMSLTEIINLSINQTLSRTILTAGTTLFSCSALYVLGGGAIKELSAILVIGIIVGTYSSIFIASPLILSFTKNKKN